MMTLALVMMAGFWSCSKDDVESDGPFIETDPAALTFSNTEDLTKSIAVKSNREWTAAFLESGVDSWILIDTKKGSGNGTIKVTVLPNDKGERSATLKLTASTASVTLKITQGEGGGIVEGDAIYQEDCGKSVDKVNDRWPYVDQFEGWVRGGKLSQTAVTYTGSSANVSNSGAVYQPGEGSPFSGAPYVGMSTPGSQFIISNINITGVTSLTFKSGALFQSAYSGSPTFGEITPNSFGLNVSLDGTNWVPMTYTTAKQGAGSWYQITTEFKVPAGSEKLYIKYTTANLVADQGYRFDDFTLYEGGNGELITPDVPGEKTYITVAQLRAKGEVTISENLYVKASVISNKDGGNATSLKNVVISDGIAGIAIRFTANADYAVGTELELSLNGAQLAKYDNGILQLNNFSNANAVATGETKVIAAKEITAADVVSGNFESMYVSVADVEVVAADLTKKMGSAADHVNIGMEARTNQTFSMFTAKYATFKDDNVPQGSGILKGITGIFVPAGGSAVYQVSPQTAGDFAGLTGPRFGGEIAFSFGTPAFTATTIKAGIAIADGKITIPYYGAEGTETYNITVAATGVGAVGIDAVDVSRTLTAGNGSIELPITGTPTTAGSVTFTITGIDGLTVTTATANVEAQQAAGSFVAEWNMFGCPLWGTSPMAMTSAGIAGVTIGDLTKTGFTTTANSPGANNWGGADFTANVENIALSAPVKYATVTVNSATKSVSLTSVEAIFRLTKTGPMKTSIQYSLDGTTFKEAGAAEFVRPSGTTTFAPVTVDFSGVADLQNVAANKTITIRLVPVATEGTTTGNWNLNSKDAATSAFVINGVAN